MAYKDSLGGMVEGVIINELLDLPRQAQQGRIHDIREISSQRLDVVAGLGRSSGCHPIRPVSTIETVKRQQSMHSPVIFGRVNEIIDL